MDETWIIYHYEGNQKQYWDCDTGWSLCTASLFDTEEKDEFLAENPEAAATLI